MRYVHEASLATRQTMLFWGIIKQISGETGRVEHNWPPSKYRKTELALPSPFFCIRHFGMKKGKLS